MKKLLPGALALFVSAVSYAQTPFNAIEYIDINNIKASCLVHGDAWYDPGNSSNIAAQYPNGSGKRIAGRSGIWIGGYNLEQNLQIAVARTGAATADYWPGPVDSTVPIAQRQAYSEQWAKVWRVNRSTIDSFRTLPPGSTIAPDILNWPAKGNPYAKGNNNTPLTITSDMAPFVDRNADGIYNPMDGDYPKIKGDQMAWWIINDYMLPHGITGTTGIGLEIKCSAYAYHRNNAADNMIFYEYSMTHKGRSPYPFLTFGWHGDLDLGDPMDDYIGFDSARRMGYNYNGVSPDGVYGTTIPAVGVVLTEMPGDQYPTLLPAGGFIPYGGTSSLDSAMNYYNVLQRKSKQGASMHDDRATGPASTAFGTGPLTDYAFPGNPANPGEWSQCQSSVPHNQDRAFVLTARDFTLLPGATRKIGMALVVSPNAGACPNTDITNLQQLGDSAIYIYWHPDQTAGIHPPIARKSLKIYPNPAKDKLYVLPAGSGKGEVMIYNAIGQRMAVATRNNNNKIELATGPLPQGVYTVIYRDDQVTASNVFIKE